MIKLIFSLCLAFALLACGPEAPAPERVRADASEVPADALPDVRVVEAGPVDAAAPDASPDVERAEVREYQGETSGVNLRGAVTTSRAWCPSGWAFLGRRCDSDRGPGLVLVDSGQLPGTDDAGAPQQGGFCTWRNDAPDVSGGQGYTAPQSGTAWVTCQRVAR